MRLTQDFVQKAMTAAWIDVKIHVFKVVEIWSEKMHVAVKDNTHETGR